MKKIILIFLALAGVVACSNDDNNSSELETLIVSTEKNEVFIGEQVIFKISTNKQEKIEGATLLCNNKQISDQHVFDEIGKYSIYAQKKGFNSSKPIEINVVEQVKTTLILKVESTDIDLGDDIIFKVTDNEGNSIEKAKIYNQTTQEKLEGLSYTSKDIGDFIFIAKAEGFQDSEQVSVNVNSAFVINEKNYSLDIFLVSIEVIEIPDGKGDFKQVDKVYFLDTGEPANLYNYYAISDGEEFVDLLSLEILVPNNSIKINNKREIIDYGQRILPSEVTEFELMKVVAMAGDDFFMERNVGGGVSTLGDYTLKINEFKISNKGIGAGDEGVEAYGDIIIDYKSSKRGFKLKHKGNFIFTEFNAEYSNFKIEDRSDINQLMKRKF